MVTATELEFRKSPRGPTQNEKLRDYLIPRVGAWVPMPELAKVITPTGIGAAVHSRIADCRKKFGMMIEQRTVRDQPGHSEYRFTTFQNA